MYGVTENWSFIENVIKKIPYHTFRAYRDHEEAWSFLVRRKHGYGFSGIFKYGNIFNQLHVTAEYFISNDKVYCNVDTSKIGHIRLSEPDDGTLIEYRRDLILITINLNQDDSSEPKYSPESLVCHSVAIYKILLTLGTYLDINLIVPNLSIFYMLSAYTGSRFMYKRTQDLIEKRAGELAYTCYPCIKNTEDKTKSK